MLGRQRFKSDEGSGSPIEKVDRALLRDPPDTPAGARELSIWTAQGLVDLMKTLDELRAALDEELSHLRSRDLVLEERLDALQSGRAAEAQPSRETGVAVEPEGGQLAVVSKPLVLLSDAHPPHGEVVHRVLNGHRELLVLPQALLQTTFPGEITWPELNLGERPRNWFRELNQASRQRQPRDESGADAGEDAGEEKQHGAAEGSSHRKLFARLVAQREVRTQRRVFDCYLTANLPNLGQAKDKKWVLSYVPGVMSKEARSGFDRDYPDGRLVVCLSDPGTFVAEGADEEESGFELSLQRWEEAARRASSSGLLDDERAFVLPTDELLTHPKRVLGALGEFLGIDPTPSLALLRAEQRRGLVGRRGGEGGRGAAVSLAGEEQKQLEEAQRLYRELSELTGD